MLKSSKYRKKSNIIFIIFLLAAVLVAAALIYIYTFGVRYIKTSVDVKFFGFVDKNNNANSGRFWRDDGTVVNVTPQNHYIVELKGVAANDYIEQASLYLYKPGISFGDDILERINELIPEELTETYALNHFIFNNTGEGVSFYKESITNLLRQYDNQSNPPVSGKFYSQDGIEWLLISTKTSAASYKDFEIVQSNDRSKKYKGDIPAFLSQERLIFGSLTLKNGDLIYLYPALNISRFKHQNGNQANDLYIGEINNQLQKHGKGIYYYSKSGDIVYGTFVSERKTGKFKNLFADGDSYDGDLIESKKDGEGVWRWSNGEVYEGQFKNDMKHGFGVNKFADGSVYTGDYVEGAKHGEGTYVFANGDMYAGSFEYDVFSGNGSYQWASGEYYTGNFENNAIHGEGTYYWTSGRTYKGNFENGRMVRERIR